MPITGMTRAYARKQGIPGFAARQEITDDLITSSLEKKRQLDQYKTDVAAKTDITTTEMNTSARLREALLGKETTLQQEGMQQRGLTARQRITQAGDIALQKLQGNQALTRQRESDFAAFSRVGEAGKQARKTKKTKSFQDEMYEKLIKDGVMAGAGAATTPYTYAPEQGLAIENPVDLEDYLEY